MRHLIQVGGREAAVLNFLKRFAVERLIGVNMFIGRVAANHPLWHMHHLHVLFCQPEHVFNQLAVLRYATGIHLAFKIRHNVLGQHAADQGARPIRDKVGHAAQKSRAVPVGIAGLGRVLFGPQK